MNREEAIKIIKAKFYPSHVGLITNETFENAKALRMAIEALSIVRCKDCKHWYADADTGMACEFTNMGQPEDGYCNWGERKGGVDE